MRSTALLVLALLLLSSMAAYVPLDRDAPETRSRGTIQVDASGGGDHLTIQAAIDAAGPGDTINVAAGTYLENLVIDVRVHLVGEGYNDTIIDGGWNDTVVTVVVSGVKIENFTVRWGGWNRTGIDIRGVDGTSISDCKIFGNRICIRGDQGSDDTIVKRCAFEDYTKSAVWLVGDSNVVANNSVSRGEIGISVTGTENQVLGNYARSCDVGANSLDAILERLLRNTVPDADTTRLSGGGLKLSDHSSRALTAGHSWNTTLNGGTNWDTLILQDQSQVPGFPTSNPNWQSSLAGAGVLDGMAEEAGADTVLMMTWGRRDGDSGNPTLYPNYTVMQDRLEVGYLAYAENLSAADRPAYVAPVGMAFKYIHDDILGRGGNPLKVGSLFYSLYSTDGSHPSLWGSYLAACVLYATLTGNSPLGLIDITPVDAATKLQLQQAAGAAVFVDTPTYVYPWRNSTGNRVANNTLSNNVRGLVMGCLADSNEVTENLFSRNHGLALEVLDAKSRNNLFHHNGFQDNNAGDWQAADRGNNERWYSGREGNWWSDYKDRYPNATVVGTVWDTAYGSLDPYPLVNLWDLGDDLIPPVADAGPDLVVDEDTEVFFNGNLSTDDKGLISWTWSFEYEAETISLSGVNPAFWFNVPGVYAVTLVVMDAAGNLDVDHMNVTVRDVTDPVAIALVVVEDVHSPTRTLDGRSSSDNVGIVNWTWTFADVGGTVHLFGRLVDHVFSVPGTYSIQLRVIDGAGNAGYDSINITIADVDDPVADAGLDQEVDQGTWVTLDGSASTDNMAIEGYTWAFSYMDQTVLLSGPSPTHYFGEAGVYTIGLRVTDGGGNTADDIVTITVRDTTPPVADAGGDQVIDQGRRTTLDATASTDNVEVTGWTWEFIYRGIPRTLDTEIAHYTFEWAEVYTVTLTVRDAMGNTGTDTFILTVKDTEAPVANPGPPKRVDMGDTVTLNGTGSRDNVGIVKYTWAFEYDGKEVQLNGEVVTYPFAIPGRYQVDLSVQDAAGQQDTSYMILTVRDTEPPFVPKMKDVTVSFDELVVFNASGARDNVDIYRWSWSIDGDDYSKGLTGRQVSHKFSQPGDYKVTLTVGDQEGNEASETFTVHVENGPINWNPIIIALVILVGIVLVVLLDKRRGQTGQLRD
jgi:parallel beta-helix repeat protein